MKEVWAVNQEVGFGHTVFIGVSDSCESGLSLMYDDCTERFKNRTSPKRFIVGDWIDKQNRESTLVLVAIHTDRRRGDNNHRVVLRLDKMFRKNGETMLRGWERLALYSITKYPVAQTHDPESCESCETLVRHGFPDYEQVL